MTNYPQIAADEIGRLRAELATMTAKASRYDWLKERFTGYDFNWMPSEVGAQDGKVCAVFDVGLQFRGGRDLDEAIDTFVSDHLMAEKP